MERPRCARVERASCSLAGAFACLPLEGGRLRSSLGTQKRSCQLGLPVFVVALEVVKKAPKGKLPMSLSWL